MDFTDKIEPLARAFSKMLIADLGHRKMIEVCVRNDDARKAGITSTCASHDFCDANIVMLAAVESLDIRDDAGNPADVEFLANDQAANTLWNSAWKMAGDNRFWLNERALDISAITPELYDSVANVSSLDEALGTIMKVVDPNNYHDLGGQAAHWFDTAINYVTTAGKVIEAKAADAWPYLDPWERVNHLKVFFVAAASIVDPLTLMRK